MCPCTVKTSKINELLHFDECITPPLGAQTLTKADKNTRDGCLVMDKKQDLVQED